LLEIKLPPNKQILDSYYIKKNSVSCPICGKRPLDYPEEFIELNKRYNDKSEIESISYQHLLSTEKDDGTRDLKKHKIFNIDNKNEVLYSNHFQIISCKECKHDLKVEFCFGTLTASKSHPIEILIDKLSFHRKDYRLLGSTIIGLLLFIGLISPYPIYKNLAFFPRNWFFLILFFSILHIIFFNSFIKYVKEIKKQGGFIENFIPKNFKHQYQNSFNFFSSSVLYILIFTLLVFVIFALTAQNTKLYGGEEALGYINIKSPTSEADFIGSITFWILMPALFFQYTFVMLILLISLNIPYLEIMNEKSKNESLKEIFIAMRKMYGALAKIHFWAFLIGLFGIFAALYRVNFANMDSQIISIVFFSIVLPGLSITLYVYLEFGIIAKLKENMSTNYNRKNTLGFIDIDGGETDSQISVKVYNPPIWQSKRISLERIDIQNELVENKLLYEPSEVKEFRTLMNMAITNLVNGAINPSNGITIKRGLIDSPEKIRSKSNSEFDRKIRLVGNILYREYFQEYFGDGIKSLYSTNHQNGDNQPTVFIKATGKDLYLPWEWLSVDDNRGPLCLYANVVRGSGHIKEFSINEFIVNHILIVGASAKDSQYRYLPNVEKEVQEIINQIKGKWTIDHLIGSNATKPKFIEAIRNGKPQIIHFCGHFIFNRKSPKESIFILNDNTTLSITALFEILKEENPIKMLFLNSCETGMQPRSMRDENTNKKYLTQKKYKETLMKNLIIGQEKLDYLALQLHFFGIPYLIGQTFEISDETSVEFARIFYSYLIQGFLPEIALRKTRKDIFNKFDGDPIWASSIIWKG